MMPVITMGIVISQQPEKGAVTVNLRASGNTLGGVPVRVLYHGEADALRIRQRPLPGLGTWGLIVFPYGAPINGVWLGSMFPSQMDAISTLNTDTDPFIDYHSHFSGFWKMLDGTGQLSLQFPDGTSLAVGASGTLATTYRHVVDNDSQVQSKQELTFDQRVADPPDPFVLNLVHSSGSKLSIDAEGNVTVSLTGSSKLIVQQGSNTPSDFLVLVSKFLTQFNEHTHPTPSGTSGPPTTALEASDVKSTLIDMSN